MNHVGIKLLKKNHRRKEYIENTYLFNRNTNWYNTSKTFSL